MASHSKDDKGLLADHPESLPTERARLDSLTQMNGVVVRQQTQLFDVLFTVTGAPCERPDIFKVAALPPGVQVMSSPSDGTGWRPTGEDLEHLPTLVAGKEESSCWTRCCFSMCGCLHLRPFNLPLKMDRDAPSSVFRIDRPYMCGGCCCPLEMDVFGPAADGHGEVPYGRVKEDCSPCPSKAFQALCCCTFFHRVERSTTAPGVFDPRYTLRANLACCGRVNNCCGGTCCKESAIYDVLDTSGAPVAKMQKTYASTPSRGCCDKNSAFCRMCFKFNNYVVEFPADASAEDRAMLTVAAMQLNYQHFARRGNENNN